MDNQIVIFTNVKPINQLIKESFIQASIPKEWYKSYVKLFYIEELLDQGLVHFTHSYVNESIYHEYYSIKPIDYFNKWKHHFKQETPVDNVFFVTLKNSFNATDHYIKQYLKDSDQYKILLSQGIQCYPIEQLRIFTDDLILYFNIESNQ